MYFHCATAKKKIDDNFIYSVHQPVWNGTQKASSLAVLGSGGVVLRFRPMERSVGFVGAWARSLGRITGPDGAPSLGLSFRNMQHARECSSSGHSEILSSLLQCRDAPQN
jgi:hypothetical protein